MSQSKIKVTIKVEVPFKYEGLPNDLGKQLEDAILKAVNSTKEV